MRLKAAVPLWLPDYEREHGALEGGPRGRVLKMSAATMDQLLAPCRVSLGSRGRCGTRPGTLLRKQIPIRTEHWDVAGPGWLEADTVAHCTTQRSRVCRRESNHVGAEHFGGEVRDALQFG